jgi:hypothetical protein
MTNEDRRPQRGIVIEIVKGLGQTVKCIRVDPVEHLWTIDANEDYRSPPLHHDLDIRR